MFPPDEGIAAQLSYDATLWPEATKGARGMMPALDKAHHDILWTRPSCRVYHSVDQSISSGGSPTALAFDSELFDALGMHDNSTNNSRITIPTGYDGLWLFGANPQFNTGAGNRALLRLSLNNATDFAGDEGKPEASTFTHLFALGLYRCVAGDYVQAKVYQDTGGAVNVIASNYRTPGFWAVFLGVY